ncbi:hypothetical protein [Streptomyces sp. NPDC088554]|uniref:hypothetical protein n=1 Tax=Streptomyces sp. NPDC088554 TaxID=3365865 RepID=UPI0038112F56
MVIGGGAAGLSDEVTLFPYTGPEPYAEQHEQHEQPMARHIAVVSGEVTGLQVTDDRLTCVVLADGRGVPGEALVVTPRFTTRAGFLEGLGLETVDQARSGQVIGGRVPAGPTGATEVPGVWVAGNVTDLTGQVMASAAGGVLAGAAINADPTAEETRRAVDARRTADARRAARHAEAQRTDTQRTDTQHTEPYADQHTDPHADTQRTDARHTDPHADTQHTDPHADHHADHHRVPRWWPPARAQRISTPAPSPVASVGSATSPSSAPVASSGWAGRTRTV